MRDLPPLSYLQAFEAAARHLSFTEAAKELNCTQAAVSQRVRGLEAYLARQLFLRRPNGLELLEVGEAYLPGIAEALDIAASATEGLHRGNIHRTVTISAPLSFVTLWLMPRLGRFLATSPDIEIRANSAIWTDPNVDLADVTIEVRDAAELDTSMPKLPPEQVVLACSPAHANRFSGLSLEEALGGLRHLHIQGKHHLWERWAKLKGITLDQGTPLLKLDNAVSALEGVAQGLGVVVSFSTYCAPYIASGRLITPAGAQAKTTLCHILTKPPTRPRWHPAHRVYDWLRREFEISDDHTV